jgi:hypothetical protein
MRLSPTPWRRKRQAADTLYSRLRTSERTLPRTRAKKDRCYAFNTLAVKHLIALLLECRYDGVCKKKVAKGREEVSRDMTEEQEVRASREEVEGFVSKLKDFHGSLSESEQAMLDTILDSAQGETGGYRRAKRGDEASWNDMVGWIEEQGEEETQGFRIGRKGLH